MPALLNSGAETIRPYIDGGPIADLVDVREAAVTLADLEAVQATVLQTVRNLRVRADAEIDVIHNHVKLSVVDRGHLDAALAAAGSRLPDRVAVIEVEELLTPTADIYAGYYLNLLNGVAECTAGYSVKNSVNWTGVSAAGHCSDSMETSTGIALSLIDEWYFTGLPYDVQWHGTPNLTDRPWAKDQSTDATTPGYREIWGTIGRNSQAVGDFVCKYGRATGKDCGNITSRTVVGVGPNGTQLDNTFIRVDGGSNDIAQYTDSGGPCYDGNYAIGIMHAQIGDDAVYMAINYVQEQGLRIRTVCNDQQC